MPLITDNTAKPFGFSSEARPEGYEATPEPQTLGAPSVGETFGTAFRQENEVLGAIKQLDQDNNFGSVDHEHNPWASIQGTELEPYADAFVASRNQKETDHIAGLIRKEIENRKILERSNPALVFGAGMVASVLSPTTLIPGGVIYRGMKVGRAAMKSALAVGTANAAAAGIQEGILHGQQYTRTGEESAFAIGGSFLLAAILGGAASGLSSAKFKNLADALDRDLNVGPRIDEAYAAKMGEATGRMGEGGVGAQSVAIPDAELKGALGLEKTLIKTEPVGRSMNRMAPEVANAEVRIAEMPMILTRNAEGVPTAPIGGAIETRYKTQGIAREGAAMEGVKRFYADYRFGDPATKLPGFKNLINPDKTKLSPREFREEIGKAMARGDAHDIPQVAKAAKHVRETLIDPIADAAVKANLLSREVVRKGRPKPAATVGEAPATPELPKASPQMRSSIDGLLSQLEGYTGQKFDKAVRERVLDLVAQNEDLLARLRELATGEPDIPFALRGDGGPVGRSIHEVVADLEKGYPVKIEREVTDYMDRVLQDARLGLPPEARDIPMHYMVGVEPKGDGQVAVSFRGVNGEFRSLDLSLSDFRQARAASLDGSLFLFRSSVVDGFDKSLIGEIQHELVHALAARGVLGGDVLARLSVHAESLRIMDMSLNDMLRRIDHPDAGRAQLDEPLSVTYNLKYKNRGYSDELTAELVNEEAIAHMAELRAHGKLTAEELAPIADDMERLFGPVGGLGAARQKAVADWVEQLGNALKVDPDGGVQFALRGSDIDVGRSMRADLDRLGYFSGALEAAKRLRQNKGTPEQMLAMLQKEGAKKAEIEATGLDKFILGRETDAGAAGDGRPSATGAASAEGRTAGQRAANVSRNQITKSEIIKYLEDKVKQTVKEQGQPLFAMRGLDMSPEARKARAEENFNTKSPWFHGTTHDVVAFDPSKANIEGHLGRSVYLSSSADDIGKNYAGVGPDLTNRIEQLAERIEAERDISYDEARILATEQLKGSDGASMPLYVRKDMKILRIDKDYIDFEGRYDEATDEFAESENAIKVYEALNEAAREFDEIDVGRVMEDAQMYDSVRASDFDATLRKSEGLIYATDENGNLASNEIIRRIYQALGYDAVEIDANATFKNMEMPAGTRHLMVFDPTNIRSVNAAFDPSEAGSANLMFALRDLSRRLDAPLVDDLGKSDPHPGRVMAVHGTKAQPFDQFDPVMSADFGIHFGTRDQADIPAGYTTTRENARMIPVVLDLKTVVDVPDMMTWPPVEVAAAVEKAYPLARGLEDRVRAVIAAGSTETGPTGSVRPSREALAAGKAELRRLMTEAKIDGLRYWNDSEGEGWSYIVWDEGKVSSATSGEPMMGVKPDGQPQFALRGNSEDIPARAAEQPEQPRFPDYAARAIADQIQALTQDLPMVTRADDGAVDTVRMGDQVYRVVRGEDGSVQGVTVDAEAAGDFAPNANGLDDAGVAAVARSIKEIVKRSGGPELDEAVVQDIVRRIAAAVARGDDPAAALRSNMSRSVPQMMFATRGEDILKKIRELGGIKDETGDLANMGAGERKGIINNETGLSPDAMRAHMVEQGYLNDVPYEDVTQSSVNDLYDMISEALSDQGGRGRAYREELAYQALRSAQTTFEEAIGVKLELTPEQEQQLISLILDQRLSPDDALERLGMMGAEDKPKGRFDHNANPERYTQSRRFMDDLQEQIDELKTDDGGDYFNEDVGDEVWGGAPGQTYIMRLYNREKIAAQTPTFRAILSDYFQESQSRANVALNRISQEVRDAEARAAARGKQAKIASDTEKNMADLQAFVGLSRQDLDEISDQVINHILGAPEGRLTFDLPKAVRGALKSRTLRIPDAFESASGKFEDFLDRDIGAISRAYVQSMVPDTEIVRMFGSLNMEEQYAKIKDQYAKMRSSPELDKLPPAQAEKIRKKLNDDMNAALVDLSAQIDRLRGTYKLPDNPMAWGPRAVRVLKEWNLIRMLGGMTVSALPDPFRVMMVHGVTSFFGDGIRPLITNMKAVKMAGEEVKMAGTALDMVLHSRIQAIADVMDNYGRYSSAERGLGWAVDKFGVLTLMNQWNSAMKQWAGSIVMTNLIKMAKKIDAGKATNKEIETLAAASIDAFTARTIAQQFAKHGMIEGGVHLPNTLKWDIADPNVKLALEAFRAAVVRDVDRIIVTPGQDKPLMASTQIGSLVFQFKSFAFASMQRTLIAGLQQRDSGVMMGSLLMIGMGMVVEYLKALTNDKPLPANTAQWVAAGVDRSGVQAWLSDANNILEKMTGGTVGVSALTGKQLSRYASRNLVGALAGPSAGTITDLGVASAGFHRALLGGDQVRESDIAALRRLIPLQNLFYLSYIFQKMEQAVSKGVGAKPSKQRSPMMDRLSSNEQGPGWLDEFVRAA